MPYDLMIQKQHLASKGNDFAPVIDSIGINFKFKCSVCCLENYKVSTNKGRHLL